MISLDLLYPGAWRLAPFVVVDGDVYDKLFEVSFGEFVPISKHSPLSSMSLVKLLPWGVLEKIPRWNLRWCTSTA